MKKNPKVYLDVAVGRKEAGRIVFELFADITPKTVENFRQLCTGEAGLAGASRKALHYQGCRFFRVIPGFMIQAGDFEKNNGSGGESIYGKAFRDESFARRHAQAGVLSMANNGRHTNGSQFFITLKRAPQLDGKHVVFGQVCEGMAVVRAIEAIPVDSKDCPRVPVVIVGCGEVGDSRSMRASDPFARMREADQSDTSSKEGRVPTARDAGLAKLEAIRSIAAAESAASTGRGPSSSSSAATNDARGSADREQQIIIPLPLGEAEGEMDERSRRLMELKMRVNQSKNLNSREVLDEKRTIRDPEHEKRKAVVLVRKELAKSDRALGDDGDADGGVSSSEGEGGDGDEDEATRGGKKSRKGALDKLCHKETVLVAAQRDAKKRRKEGGAKFGWDVFNQDSIYRAHEKRVEGDLVFKADEYERQRETFGDGFHDPMAALSQAAHKPSEEAKERMVSSIQRQQEKRAKFSRRRMFVEDEDVSYINERNRRYNKKLERAFGAEALEIRQNLERGTAL